MRETHVLSTGRVCRVDDPGLPLLPSYHVLYFPGRQGQPTDEEVGEMLALAYGAARRLGETVFDDPECYTVLLNGARARRRPWFHVHLLPVDTVGKRRWALLCLTLKRSIRLVVKVREAAKLRGYRLLP